MGDPRQDEGFVGESDLDEEKESLATDLEDGFEDPEELEDDEAWEEEEGDE